MVLLVLSPPEASAQGRAVPERRATAPYIGLAIGRGELPATLAERFYTCQNRFNGRTPSTDLEARVGTPVGVLIVESRSSVRRQESYSEAVCALMDVWLPASGIRTEQERGLEGGAFAGTDVRVGYEGATRFPWVVAAGGGWVWTQETPFLVASAGLRTPGRIRGLVDLEWNQYRIPLDRVTREWENFRPVRVVDRSRKYDWQGTWGLRLGLEVAVR